MSYSEEEKRTYYHFSEKESAEIKAFLKTLGYSNFSENYVCGDCCGMYSDYIYVNGIGGSFASKDQKALAAFMKTHGIAGSIGDYTVDADPHGHSDYQIEVD